MNSRAFIFVTPTFAWLTSCAGDISGSSEKFNDENVEASFVSSVLLNTSVKESKFYKLFEGYDKDDTFEASGVYFLGSYSYVVFDNRYNIGIVNNYLEENSPANILTVASGFNSRFEGITYDSYETPNFYVVTEGESHNGVQYGRFREYTNSPSYQKSEWTDFSFAQENTGFEGVAWLRRDNHDYLLALCEGNYCENKSESSSGNGRIEVFERFSESWIWKTEIFLPSTVTFADYSDIAIYGNKIAVTSQKSSSLWIGELNQYLFDIEGNGNIYTFPRGDNNGNSGVGSSIIYCTVEGVSFISEKQIVIVSDKAGSEFPSRCRYKDQSISIFNIP
jgi:hypothetical protein